MQKKIDFFKILKCTSTLRRCEKHSQCVSRAVESATEAISLALHNVSHALKGRVW